MIKTALCLAITVALASPAIASPFTPQKGPSVSSIDKLVVQVNNKKKTNKKASNNKPKRGPGSGDVLLGTVAEVEARDAQKRKKRPNRERNNGGPNSGGQLLEQMMLGAAAGVVGGLATGQINNRRPSDSGNRVGNSNVTASEESFEDDYQQQAPRQRGYCEPQYDTPFPKPCE